MGLRLDFGIQYSMLSGKDGLFVWVYSVVGLRLVLLCLTPLSTIFQLHRGGSILLVEENHRPVASHW